MSDALLNLAYANAVPVMLPDAEELDIFMVGCGGTGSWLAPDVVRLAVESRERWKRTSITFVDPDVVEPVNIPRQNFCQAEVGANKAEALATRYGFAWGMDIAAVTRPFDSSMVGHDWRSIVIIAGCVDNAAARKSIAATLRYSMPSSRVWWLDNGNFVQSGQVLLGSTPTLKELSTAFQVPTFCARLPSPALQHPELLKPRPEESRGNTRRVSCAEIAAANRQALIVNKQVAAHAAATLCQLLDGTLRYFALYFDQPSGAARARYITPETVAAAVGKPSKKLFARAIGAKAG